MPAHAPTADPGREADDGPGRVSGLPRNGVQLRAQRRLSTGFPFDQPHYTAGPWSMAAWVAAGVNRMSGGVRRQRLQRSLVVAQIAVSVILLTGAGLLTRTMLQLSEVKTGLNTENILTMEVPFDFEAKKDEDSKALFERMQLEVSAIPGVSEVGIGSTMPLRATEVMR